jgi:hypothetical protein
MIPANTRIRIVAGMTDMRPGLAVLSDMVQSVPQAGSLLWILQLQLFLRQNQRFPIRRLLQRPLSWWSSNAPCWLGSASVGAVLCCAGKDGDAQFANAIAHPILAARSLIFIPVSFW